jgi:CRP-like cAMP-binding protein
VASEQSPSLRSLPPLETLTAAEASVFERGLEERNYQAGASLTPGEELLLVREGTVRLEVETKRGKLSLGTLEAGGLLGEESFFVPSSQILAEAEDPTTCFVLERQFLKSSFRYSRTGAVKFLIAFAESLSQKIREANDLLQGVSTSSPSGDKGDIRPEQLTELDLRRLESLFVQRHYESEDVVFKEGDAGEELFIIRDGEVEILKESGSGKSLALARLGAGDFFGELAFIDRKPRSAAVVARSQLDVYVLPSGSLERALDYNVGTALYLTSVICKIMARRLEVTLKGVGSL